MSETSGSELPPVQAGFRFLLEVAALVGWGVIGWHAAGGVTRWFLVIALPVAAAVVWGTFRAPGDHSANGGAPVAVRGTVRLAIEFVVLLGAAVLSAIVWTPVPGLALGALIVIHYATSTARVQWLVAQRPVR